MNKCIIDANVVLLSGLYPQNIPDEQVNCAKKCIEFLKEFKENPHSALVLDSGGRILMEYRQICELRQEPNIASLFFVWVYTTMPRDENDRVILNELRENEFENYPLSEKLRNFDPPDRKYIAASYNHLQKPPIVEASDSKWWGIKDELKEVGIEVQFIDEQYIKDVYTKKFEV